MSYREENNFQLDWEDDTDTMRNHHVQQHLDHSNTGNIAFEIGIGK